MSIERFDAVEKLQSIRQQLDELTKRFSSDEVFGEWIPALDVLDEGPHYRIVLDVPGVNDQDLELAEDGNTLIVAGVRYTTEAQSLHQERPSGPFRRSLELPEPIEHGSAQASLKNGVLEVLLRKAPAPKSRGRKKASK